MSTERKKLVWLDIGTHRGQEFRSVFASDIRFALKLLKFFSRRRRHATLTASIMEARNLFDFSRSLKSRRQDLFFITVEANPFILAHPVYQMADAIFPLALGQSASDASALGRLYLVERDKGGQGSSIFTEKPNVNPADFLPCIVMDPKRFLTHLKDLLDDYPWDYDLMLRINCEGAEDEVIYAGREVFGDKLVHIFGSLKDVEEIKGRDAYKALMDFLEKEGLPFTFFSSDVESWPDSHKALATLLGS